MKRILAFLLCATLLLSVPVVNSSGAVENPQVEAAAAEVMAEITALTPVTMDSREALKKVNQKINDFCYNQGFYYKDSITNLSAFDTAIKAFNDLIDYLEGDVNADKKIDAIDALKILQFSVGKVELTEREQIAGDVDFNQEHNAKDALMMLQFSVGKRTEFPNQVVDHTPFVKEESASLLTAKGAALYQGTYQSMVDRIREDGFAGTSLEGGIYTGMYLRDASIQILAHVTQGDFDQARMILNYITEYHRAKNLDYVMYINRKYDAYHKQTDTTFFFLHSWVQFALNAPKTAQNKAYIEGSYDMVKKFANYYLDNGYLRDDKDLLYNESFEHSREGSYWQSFDLVTNVYGSQALHEMAEYFKTLDPANSKKWQEASTRIANGIHKNLTISVNGALMYAEFYGTKKANVETVPETDKKFYAGLSWVNLAPASCDWYAADPAIMEHTYQTYLTYGSVKYRSNATGKRYTMLEVYSDLNVSRPKRLTGAGNHLIGKGIAWEMLYCQKTGKTDRLAEILEFVEVNSTSIYPETYNYNGTMNDVGNQEQASWMLIANHALQSK